MHLVTGSQDGLPQGIFSKVSRYRHEVFIERLGWDLPVQDGMELDQFDRPDTVYVAAQDDEGNVVGCARLLPTTKPYLLQEVFPQLLNGLDPPCSEDVWELSRFAALDLKGVDAKDKGRISSPIALNLGRETIAYAAARGAKRLITFTYLGVERLFRHAGINAHRAGPPVMVDGVPLIACWIEVDEMNMKALSERTNTSDE